SAHPYFFFLPTLIDTTMLKTGTWQAGLLPACASCRFLTCIHHLARQSQLNPPPAMKRSSSVADHRTYFPSRTKPGNSLPCLRTQDRGTRSRSATSSAVSSAAGSGDPRGAECVASDSFLVTMFVDIVFYDFSEPTGRPPAGM